MDSIDFVDEPCTVEIRNGNAMLSWPAGQRKAVPLAVFRMEVARAVSVLAEFDAQRAVVSISAGH